MNQDFFTHRNSFLKIICSFFLLLSATVCIHAQSRQVTGRVTVANSDSVLAGVSIRVKGSNTGTISGNDGTFSINAPGNGILVFSIVGFTDQEVAVNNRSTVNVSMSSDVEALQQVVVVGYGTQKRKDLTGSIASVSSAQIDKVPVTNVGQSLQGRAAGVQITNNDASPGGNISILIRGIGSIGTGGNDPLFVIDGYPTTGGLSSINPNDIATIDVLKDASATAIYGIRAANGVVIITTKKGSKNGVQVSLDAYEAFQGKPKTYDVLNAEQFATLANEVAAADSQQNFKVFAPWQNPSSLHNVDWQNTVYRTGLTQNYSLGIRGGNDKVQSAASVGYYDQKGIVQGSFFKRYTLSLNLDYTPVPWLRSSTSAKYSYQDQNTAFGTGALVQLSQLPPTLDSGNKFTNEIKDGSGNYGFYNPIYTYVAKYGNPVYNIETNQYKNITNFLLATSSLEVTLLKSIKIKSNAGVNTNSYSGSYFQPEDGRLIAQYGGQAGATANALYSQHVNSTFEWLWENTIAFDKKFGQHTINFVGGVSAQKNTFTAMGGSGIPPNSVIRDLAQVTNLKLDAGGNGQVVQSLASEFARVNYNFGDRYYITGTIRRDGSSKFDTGHQYGVFPSGSVAWRIKEESFMQSVDWLQDLKIRGSYGRLGNQQPIPPFKYQALFSTGADANISPNNLGYPFNEVYQRGYAQLQPQNPNLKWETDDELDIGLDAAFLHGDLTFTADYFDRRSKDFLLQYVPSPQTGYTLLTKNVGDMRNKGLELALNYNHKTGNVSYGVTATFTSYQNKLTSLGTGTNNITNQIVGQPGQTGVVSLAGNGWLIFSRTNVGDPIGEFYGYQSLGVFQTQAQIDALNAASVAKNPAYKFYQKPVTRPGDRYFADINGDGHVDASDQTNIGSPVPKFYGGVDLTASYKAFDFNAYFYAVYGNKILNYEKSSLQSFQNRSFVGVQNVSKDFYENHWTPDNPSNTYSRASYNDDATGSNVPSSAWVENGSFLKLKTLTVGYTLPSALAQRISLSKVRAYVSSQNLFTITSYSGLDPEIGIQGGNASQNGIDNGTYPGSRFFTVGLNVTF